MIMPVMMMAVLTVVLVSVVLVRRNERFRRQLRLPVWKRDVHLGAANTAAVDRFKRDRNLRNAQAGGQPLEPLSRRAGRDKRSQEHVATDPGSRVDDGKTSVSHRVINMPGAQVGGKPPGSR